MFRNIAAGILLGIVMLVFALPVTTTATTSSKDVSKETSEAWETFKDYLHDQKHEAIEHGKDLLKKADAKIADMEAKADSVADDAKGEYRESIARLKKLRAEAGKKLDGLENSSSAAWDSSKEGFAKAYQDLYNAYKDASAKFK